MNNKSTLSFSLLLFFTFLFQFPTLYSGMYNDSKAIEILENMRKHYEKSIENIDDFILIMDNQTVYHKKAFENSRPYFKTRTETDHLSFESSQQFRT